MWKDQQNSEDGSLEHWLNGRSDWIRRAASELIATARHPTDGEVASLSDHCCAEAAVLLSVSHPLLAPGAIAMAPSAGELRIKRVTSIRGVNALGPKAELQLDQGQITVIYGSNGSGKTGYARLLKEMCGARVREKIQPNVFSSEVVTPSATVTLTLDGKDEAPIKWTMPDGQVSKLATVQIFDTQSAAQFCETTSPATHEPRAMRFVAALIKTSDRVAHLLRVRRDGLTSNLPELPSQFHSTSAGKFYASIKATTTAADISAAALGTKEAAQERVALKAALNQIDPGARLELVKTELLRVEQLRNEIVALQADLSDDAVSNIFELRAVADQRRSAAKDYAAKFFANVPLPGVGEASWRELWRHAANYSEKRAYPKHAHPNLEAGARCVLCQQVLADDARARLQSFSNFLTQSLETEAAAAEQEAGQREKLIPSGPSAAEWNLIGVAIGMGVEDIGILRAGVKARIDALALRVPQRDVPSVDWSAANIALIDAGVRLVSEKTGLEAIADPAGRTKQEDQLRELQAREWIATVRVPMLEEAKRKEQIQILEKAVALTNTAALTQKSNEIGAAELAGGYKDRFNRELVELRGNQLPVRLEHRREGKGKFTFFIELRDAHGNVASRTVLSEGEQRVVALASFLADATANDRSTPLIFDDPISSLDQIFEEAAARRLVALARTRQVIVFTHRLSLMALIDDAQKKLKEAGDPVSFRVEVVQREEGYTGVPSTLAVFSEMPMAGLNRLGGLVSCLKKLDTELLPIALNGSCGNFRILLERIVEFHLCAGVVVRFRRDVQTKNRIARLALIEAADCQLIDAKMTKYSAFEHSQATETPATLPAISELSADIEEVKIWLAEFIERMKPFA
jgi:energy-coupling factor transporter ATP-binding protein EcfA2